MILRKFVILVSKNIGVMVNFMSCERLGIRVFNYFFNKVIGGCNVNYVKSILGLINYKFFFL